MKESIIEYEVTYASNAVHRFYVANVELAWAHAIILAKSMGWNAEIKQISSENGIIYSDIKLSFVTININLITQP